MQSRTKDERRSNRARVLLAAKMMHEAGDARVRVLDLSSHGALVTGDDIPSAEVAVTLHCGKQSVSGWVAWVDGNQAGLSFNQAVSTKAFSPISAGKSHVVIDQARKTAARRPGFRGNQLSAEERYFLNQLLNDHHHIGGIADTNT